MAAVHSTSKAGLGRNRPGKSSGRGGILAKRRKRRASRKPQPVRRREEDPALPRPGPDLSSIMVHFNEALSLLVVCQRSLVAVDEAVHEEEVMRSAIALFRDVNEEIDAAERLIHADGG